MMGLLSPDQIAALDYANQQLKTQRSFTGRLPNGAYQYGTKQFIVSAAGITMTNAASCTVEADEVETTERVKVIKPKSMTKEPRVSAGIGLATGAVFLGEGKLLETNQVFEPRTMLSFDLRPQVTVSNELGFATLELAARTGQHSTTNALMFIPSVTVGKMIGQKLVLVCAPVLISPCLTFHEADYIKRSVGYTFGLEGVLPT